MVREEREREGEREASALLLHSAVHAEVPPMLCASALGRPQRNAAAAESWLEITLFSPSLTPSFLSSSASLLPVPHVCHREEDGAHLRWPARPRLCLGQPLVCLELPAVTLTSDALVQSSPTPALLCLSVLRLLPTPPCRCPLPGGLVSGIASETASEIAPEVASAVAW